MEWNGMEWNGMEWNGTRCDGMERDAMEWNAMRCDYALGIFTPRIVWILFTCAAL